MLTFLDKITELKACYTNAQLAALLNVSTSTIDTSQIRETPTMCRSVDNTFAQHCMENAEDVDIHELVHKTHTKLNLVSTPDGFQPIIKFFRKQPRNIFHLTAGEHRVRCSHDHLIETPAGWTYAELLAVGDHVVTKTGISQITATQQQDAEAVYDFEVGHDNHRYWSGGFSSHNSGKSFISANLVRSAQEAGAICLVIDSENALDDEFMSKIGVNVTSPTYKYVSVTTIAQVSKIVSGFLKGYKKDAGEGIDAPQVFILIDSLDMLMTETETEHYDKGVTKGDQGQRNKQLKAMLRTFVQDIKTLNVAMVCTSQVYKNQDILNGEGVWIVSDAVKYAASQIILIQKRKLKDESKGAKAGDVAGVRMICEGYKTRFTKPFQKVEIEVPYEEGMDPLSGLLDVATKLGVVDKRGSRYAMAGQDETWYSRDLHLYVNQIIVELDAKAAAYLDVDVTADVIVVPTE